MIFRACILGAATLLAACATTSKPSTSSEARAWRDVRAEALAHYRHWTFDGHIAITTENDSWHGSLHWEQRNTDFDIEFRTPLGQVAMQLHNTPGQAVLNLPDARTLNAPSTNELMNQQFGWNLPIEALQQWVIGEPYAATDAKNIELDAEGRITQMDQMNWHVEFKRYARVRAIDLPEKIFATNDPMSVRLVIDQWIPP